MTAIHAPSNGPRLAEAFAWAGPLVLGVALIAGWEAAVGIFGIEPYLLPTPTDVWRVLVEERALLWADTRATAVEILLSFPIAIVLGIGLGLLTASWSPFRRAAYPLIVAMQSMPMVAAAPLFAVWFGFGLVSKVMIATILAYFAILVGTVTGLQSVGTDELRLGRTIGLSRSALFWKIELPAALPSILGGLKVASTLIVIGAMVGEFVGASSGLGVTILRAAGTVEMSLLFAAVAVLVVLGGGLYAVVSLAQRVIAPWSATSERT